MLTSDVFERAGDFRAGVADVRFLHYQWQFLAELDGRATAGEILSRLGLDEAEMTPFIERQVESGLIVPSLMTYDDFTRIHEAQSRKATESVSTDAVRPRSPLVFTLSGASKGGSNGENPHASS